MTKQINKKAANLVPDNVLYSYIRQLIEESKQKVYSVVNAEITMLYWNIGKYINDNIKSDKATDYGKNILPTLSAKLSWSHFVELLSVADALQREFYYTIPTCPKKPCCKASCIKPLNFRNCI